MQILIIDNYDSFTFNLYHYFQQLADDVRVKRNDEIRIEEAEDYSHLVISPGPGLPIDAGITRDLIKHFFHTKPIMGVCLGCQALAEFTGANLYNQPFVAHGIQRVVKRTRTDSWLFKNIPSEFKVGLYHSWAVEEKSINLQQWHINAKSKEDVVMGIEHTELPVAGVQFHPESVMTDLGINILKNWLQHSMQAGTFEK